MDNTKLKLLNSIQLSSVQLNSIQLNSTELNSTPPNPTPQAASSPASAGKDQHGHQKGKCQILQALQNAILVGSGIPV